MQAVILAAGFGTRLRPLTDTVPKPMIPVLGVPNIERVVRFVASFGVTRIAVNLHHRPEPIVDHLGDGSRFGVDIAYSREERILGTGGGIKKAAALLGTDDHTLVVNGDVLFRPDLSAVEHFHIENGAVATMVVREDPRALQLGVVGLNESGEVGRLVWAGDETRGPRAHMFTGVHILSPDALDHLPDDGCVVRDTYIPMVERDAPIHGFPARDYFCDLGTPEAYLDASIGLCRGTAMVRGINPPKEGVFVDEEAVLDPGARILEGSVVCSGAVIAGAVDVKESIVMPEAKVEEDASRCIILKDGTRIYAHRD